MSIKATINGYEVELVVYDSDPSADVFVTKGAYSNSLASLCTQGLLIHDNCEKEVRVPKGTIDQIERWAENNGY